ncbi:MAG: hypothetical protein M3552_04325 [Planctomycetota bacterium]|nr:hypothetical protein [Planctomycetota bacterium]
MPDRNGFRAIGLVIAALAIGFAYLYGGFVPRHELILAPAAVICLAVAFWCGLRRSGGASPFRRLRSTSLWVIVVLAVLFLPASLRWAWLQRELSTIPIPADAYDVQRETNVVFWNPYPGPYSLKYVTRVPFDDADRFLMEGFRANGWKVGGRFRAETYGAAGRPSQYMAERFERQPQAGRLRNYTMIHADRWMNVTLFDAGEECWIACETQGEPPPESLRRFWR